MTDRRSFLETGILLTGAGILSSFRSQGENYKSPGKSTGTGLKLTFKPYELQLRNQFTIAGSSRKTTAVMLTELEWEGVTGYGEASMPPYLGESHQTATKFLSSLNLSQFRDPFRMEEILSYVDNMAEGNCAAKASVDIALHDLAGKLLKQPWHKLWGYNPENTPLTTFTIGMDTPE
ncbi:MAG TPA: hypothetical protein VN249_04525, partial [Prolixibacteraceae bacterium]|nr:hypothetical protein [Prolixibacteraceae bacterium]